MSITPILRPMNVGDILDQTFTLYRKNFATLVSIVAVVQVPLLILQIAAGLVFGLSPDLFNNAGRAGTDFSSAQALALLVAGITFVAAALLAAIASVFETAALSVVVSERYLGRAISTRQAYARTLRRWPSLLGAILLLGLINFLLLAVLVMPFVFFIAALALSGPSASGDSAAGVLVSLNLCLICLLMPVLIVVAYALNTRWLFTSQIVVLEGCGALDSLRRSWNLVSGSFWRVLGISIVLSILIQVITLAPTFFLQFVILVLPWSFVWVVLNSVVGSVIQTLILPIQFAALTLLYYDLRIRKEGFDLQFMAQQMTPVQPPSALHNC